MEVRWDRSVKMLFLAPGGSSECPQGWRYELLSCEDGSLGSRQHKSDLNVAEVSRKSVSQAEADSG